MKVTVEQFLNAGYKFVAGDIATTNSIDGMVWDRHISDPISWNTPSSKDANRYIKSLTPRPNLGTQPVADDCWVEITGNNGNIYVAQAINVPWFKTVDKSQNGAVYAVVSWKPSLKHLEQQMNDKQESVMNISERDIENAFIKQEDVEVERELSESGESEYDRGMRECVQDIANLIGLNFPANIGYTNLADAVESAINPVMTESDEWVNGDKAKWRDCDDCIFIGFCSDDKFCVVERNGGVEMVFVSELSKPLTPEQLAAKELFELSFESANLSGVKVPCVYEWGRLSEKEKNYWVIFSETINFKRDK